MTTITLNDVLPKAETLDEIILAMEMYPMGGDISWTALYNHLKTFQEICNACKKHNIKSIYGIFLPEEEGREA